jgi:hypothetical protein
LKAVREYPNPKNVKYVRILFGLDSFYRRLVPNFAEVVKPLTMLTRKDQQFIWSPSQQEAFEGMKDRLCKTPTLFNPNFEFPFIPITDVSKISVATILSQVQDGVQRLNACASRQINKAEQPYSASESEMFALVWAN